LWCWLTVLARSAVADYGRRRSRWWKFLQRWRLESDLRAIPAASCGFSDRLDSALAQLDEGTRHLLEAKYYRRQSVRAIAAESGATEKAVEGRLARARRTLAKLLEHPSRRNL
jgi:RNA polymerase sigma-70 factor (ECF subfamily)